MDDGGTANGGIDTDATARSITFDVTEVTDLFIGSRQKGTFTETTDCDFFNGNGGKDRLCGNGGPDMFVLERNAGRETVYDFETDDIADLSHAKGINGYLDLIRNHLDVKFGTTVISADDGSSLILRDIAANELSRANF